MKIEVLLLAGMLVPFCGAAQGDGLTSLEARARADSNDPAVLFNLGSALFKARRYEDAEQSLRQAVRVDPQHAQALYLLAQVNERRAAPLVVRVSGRRILFLRNDPRASETALLLRRAFLIDPLLEVGSPNRDWLPTAWRGTLSLALHHYDRQRWNDAIAGFQSVIDRTTRPNDSTRVPPVALWFRARGALHTGDFDGAIRHLEWLLTLRMQDSTAERMWNPFAGDELRYIIAFVHQQARRWDEAIRRYQEVAQSNLGVDAVHTHLAEIYEAQDRWAEAVQERVRAIHANPDALSLLFNLGSTLASTGRYAEAEPILARYAANYPRDARTYYLLGVARAALADTAGARGALSHYLAMAPSRYDAQIADARQRLSALGPPETQD
jgi:tetratricopeptide (TPR) repeat protein